VTLEIKANFVSIPDRGLGFFRRMLRMSQLFYAFVSIPDRGLGFFRPALRLYLAPQVGLVSIPDRGLGFFRRVKLLQLI